ncbi:MAG: hypothetical protein ACJAVV_002665 [Alphaproteobacteria bacterium]|jgi:hypothetical protein
MNKTIKLIATLCAFVAIAFVVYLAGDLAMSDSPILALVPVGVLLFSIILYIRLKDKED